MTSHQCLLTNSAWRSCISPQLARREKTPQKSLNGSRKVGLYCSSDGSWLSSRRLLILVKVRRRICEGRPASKTKDWVRLSTDLPIAGMDDKDCVDAHRKSFDTVAGRQVGSRLLIGRFQAPLLFQGGHRVGIG